MLLNAENLFILSDQKLTENHTKIDEVQWRRLSTSIYENKPLAKIKAIVKIIKEVNPDLLMLTEVGGLESLNNLNRLFLEESFSPALIEGNSARNIDIGFLIKKSCGFYFDLISNKNRPINFLYQNERANKGVASHKFSRDAAELHLFTTDKEKPFLIFILTHLKSRLDPDNIDTNGYERRAAELSTLIELYHELEKKYDSKVPIAIAGDFNGNARLSNTDQEFKPIYEQTGLLDVCEIAKLPADQTATYYQVGRSSKTEGKQLDYCFLSPNLAPHLNPKSVQIYRYKDDMGLPHDPPTNLDAKSELPSDHYPLIFELQNIPLDHLTLDGPNPTK